MKINLKDKRLIIVAALVVLGGFLVLNQSNTIEIGSGDHDANVGTSTDDANIDEDRSAQGDLVTDYDGLSPFTAEACENAGVRPFAVMLSGDSEARPLKGIGQADLMFEAPVLTNGITRYMGLYSCTESKVIGSLRSARHDFVPVAKGWDAIYAHWGGSKFALDLLKTGVIDNINALADRYQAYYRDDSIPQPHNGFTSYSRLDNWAERAGYRTQHRFDPYPHEAAVRVPRDERYDGTLSIGYPGAFKVIWNYDAKRDLYLRRKGTKPQIDASTKSQVRASNVIVTKTSSRQLNLEYNDLDLKGSGDMVAYIHGQEIPGRWETTGASEALRFFDKNNKELVLAKGQIWVQVVENGQAILWESEAPISGDSTDDESANE